MSKQYAGNGATWVDVVYIPADGEKINERNCAPAWKACADRSAYLKRVMPSVHSASKVATTPGYPSTGKQFWTYGNSAALESSIAAGLYVDITDCTVGDVIQVSSFAMFQRSGNMSKAIHLYADAIDRVNGTAGTQTHVTGASWESSTGLDSGQENIPIPVSISGSWTVALAGTTRLCLAFNGPTLSGGDEALVWEASIVAVRFPVLAI